MNDFVVMSDFHSHPEALEIVTKYVNQGKHVYILGDATDRGELGGGIGGFDVLIQIKKLADAGLVTYIPGNHDHFLYNCFFGANENVCMEAEYLMNYNGGSSTYKDAVKLLKQKPKEFYSLMEWLGGLPLQVEVQKGGQRYCLAHAIFNQKIYDRNPNLAFKHINSIPVSNATNPYINILWYRKAGRGERLDYLPSPKDIMIIGHTPHRDMRDDFNLQNQFGQTIRVVNVDGGLARANAEFMYVFDAGNNQLRLEYLNRNHNKEKISAYISNLARNSRKTVKLPNNLHRPKSDELGVTANNENVKISSLSNVSVNFGNEDIIMLLQYFHQRKRLDFDFLNVKETFKNFCLFVLKGKSNSDNDNLDFELFFEQYPNYISREALLKYLADYLQKTCGYTIQNSKSLVNDKLLDSLANLFCQREISNYEAINASNNKKNKDALLRKSSHKKDLELLINQHKNQWFNGSFKGAFYNKTNVVSNYIEKEARKRNIVKTEELESFLNYMVFSSTNDKDKYVNCIVNSVFRYFDDAFCNKLQSTCVVDVGYRGNSKNQFMIPDIVLMKFIQIYARDVFLRNGNGYNMNNFFRNADSRDLGNNPYSMG